MRKESPRIATSVRRSTGTSWRISGLFRLVARDRSEDRDGTAGLKRFGADRRFLNDLLGRVVGVVRADVLMEDRDDPAPLADLGNDGRVVRILVMPRNPTPFRRSNVCPGTRRCGTGGCRPAAPPGTTQPAAPRRNLRSGRTGNASRRRIAGPRPPGLGTGRRRPSCRFARGQTPALFDSTVESAPQAASPRGQARPPR